MQLQHAHWHGRCRQLRQQLLRQLLAMDQQRFAGELCGGQRLGVWPQQGRNAYSVTALELRDLRIFKNM